MFHELTRSNRRTIAWSRFSNALFFLVLLGLVLCAPRLRAQAQTQFWPEVDTYVNLSPRTRFVFVTELNSYPQTGNLQGEVGPNFDFYLRPFLRPRLRDLDPAKSKLLTFRIGYRYFPTLVGDRPTENRPLTELTARFHIPLSILLSDRSREEFRFISGKSFSWRYRNRLTLERNVLTRKYIFTPYVRDEFYYTNRQISANAVMIGSIFPTTKHSELELYYRNGRIITTTPNSYIRGAGLILSLYF
jgi:Protein of unknown function (DUF2490)